jgi:hypothetical protein
MAVVNESGPALAETSRDRGQPQVSEVNMLNVVTSSVESKVRTAVKRARNDGLQVMPGASGVTIIDGRWTALPSRRVCPLGAMLIGTVARGSRSLLQNVFDDCAFALGVSAAWIHELISAIDDDEDPSGANEDAARLGEDLRAFLDSN